MEIETSENYRMRKRRELMADGRRYIIYYTFGENAGEPATETDARMPSAEDETRRSEIK